MTDSYQRISKQTLGYFLNQDGAQLKETITANGWKEEGDLVQFPLSDSNQATPKKIVENVHFDREFFIFNILFVILLLFNAHYINFNIEILINQL